MNQDKPLKFSQSYPVIAQSKLFGTRYEVNKILKQNAEKVFLKKLSQIFPAINIKTEIIATTYFEPILMFEPKKSCIVRYRQRTDFDTKNQKYHIPKKWVFDGPGTLEVKLRDNAERGNVDKQGTFFPNTKDINIKTFLNQPTQSKVEKYIEYANNMQYKCTLNKHLRLLDPKTISKITEKLYPYATRLNIRYTLETKTTEEIRITFETNPVFYIYPIYHKTGDTNTKPKQFIADIGEVSNRTKIEVKTETKAKNSEIYKNLEKELRKFQHPTNTYTDVPYANMIVKASLKTGTLINEAPNIEIESKASLPNQTNIAELIETIRNELLKTKNPKYLLFLTDPRVGLREYPNVKRTIFGYQDENDQWHEAVRLNQDISKKTGYVSLKWKSDANTINKTLVRKEVTETFDHKLTHREVIELVKKRLGKKVVPLGSFTKTKYRILVQDTNGRNFNISVDKVNIYNSSICMVQLESEYIHTVVANNDLPNTSVSEACESCMKYFQSLLKKIGVVAVPTTERKLDFLIKNKLR